MGQDMTLFEQIVMNTGLDERGWSTRYNKDKSLPLPPGTKASDMPLYKVINLIVNKFLNTNRKVKTRNGEKEIKFGDIDKIFEAVGLSKCLGKTKEPETFCQGLFQDNNYGIDIPNDTIFDLTHRLCQLLHMPIPKELADMVDAAEDVEGEISPNNSKEHYRTIAEWSQAAPLFESQDTEYVQLLNNICKRLQDEDDKHFLKEGRVGISDKDKYMNMYTDFRDNKLGVRIAQNPFFCKNFQEGLKYGIFNEPQYMCLVYLNEAKFNKEYNKFVKSISNIRDGETNKYMEMDKPTDLIPAESGNVEWSKFYKVHNSYNDINGVNGIDNEKSKKLDSKEDKDKSNQRISSNGDILTINNPDAFKKKSYQEFLSANPKVTNIEDIPKDEFGYLSDDRIESQAINSYFGPGNNPGSVVSIQKASDTNLQTREDYYLYVARASFNNPLDIKNWEGLDPDDELTYQDGGSIYSKKMGDLSYQFNHILGTHDVPLARNQFDYATAKANGAAAKGIAYYGVHVEVVNPNLLNELIGNRNVFIGIGADMNGTNISLFGDAEDDSMLNVDREVIQKCFEIQVNIAKARGTGEISQNAGIRIPYLPNRQSYDFIAVPLMRINTKEPGRVMGFVQSIEYVLAFNKLQITRANILNVIDGINEYKAEGNTGDYLLSKETFPYKFISNAINKLKPLSLNENIFSEVTKMGAVAPKDIFTGKTIFDNFVKEVERKDLTLDKALLTIDSEIYQKVLKKEGDFPLISDFGFNGGRGNNYSFSMGGYLDGITIRDEDMPGEKWRRACYLLGQQSGQKFGISVDENFLVSNYGRVKIDGRIENGSKNSLTSYPPIKNGPYPFYIVGEFKNSSFQDILNYIESGTFNRNSKIESVTSPSFHGLVCMTWCSDKLLKYSHKKNGLHQALYIHHIDSNPHHCAPSNLAIITQQSNNQFSVNREKLLTGVGLFFKGMNGIETALLAWRDDDPHFGELETYNSAKGISTYEWGPAGTKYRLNIPKSIIRPNAEIMDRTMFQHLMTAEDAAMCNKLVCRKVTFCDYEEMEIDGSKATAEDRAKSIIGVSYKGKYYSTDSDIEAQIKENELASNDKEMLKYRNDTGKGYYNAPDRYRYNVNENVNNHINEMKSLIDRMNNI